LHPALVHFPIAFLYGGIVLDLYALARGRPELVTTATGILKAGVILGSLTAAAVILAFFTVPGMHAEWAHKAVLWHLGLAATGLVLMTIAVVGRTSPTPSAAARTLGIVAVLVIGAASWLGGTVVYHAGMGVDPDVVITRTPATKS